MRESESDEARNGDGNKFVEAGDMMVRLFKREMETVFYAGRGVLKCFVWRN